MQPGSYLCDADQGFLRESHHRRLNFFTLEKVEHRGVSYCTEQGTHTAAEILREFACHLFLPSAKGDKHTKYRPGCGLTFHRLSLLQSRVITVLHTVPSASKSLLIERFSNLSLMVPVLYLYCYLSRSKMVFLLSILQDHSQDKKIRASEPIISLITQSETSFSLACGGKCLRTSSLRVLPALGCVS